MSLFSKALVLSATTIIGISFAASAPPPQWDSELIFDDFNDVYGDAINRTCLGAIQGYSEYPGSFTKGKAGYWYTYSSNSEGSGAAMVANPGDEELTESNIKTGFDATEQCMHAKFLIDDNEEYCAIAANLVGEKKYVDLSKMTSISLKVKGSGSIRLYLETKYIANKYSWGHLGKVIDLTAAYKTITIPVADLEPAPYSDAEADGVEWADCKTGVTALAFESAANEDGDKLDAEFYIDDIIFKGMIYSDIVTPVDPDPVTTSYSIHTKNSFSVADNKIAYTIAQPQNVSFSVIDLNGNVVSRINGQNGVGTHSIALPTLSAGNYIVKMNGLNGFSQQVKILK